MYLGDGSATPTPTNIISCGYRRPGRARMNRHRILLTDAGRCHKKLVSKTNDPIVQRVRYENEERMLLASFVTGLIGTPGRQVRYASPLNLDQALKIALSDQKAEKQETFSESFYASFDYSLRQHFPSLSHRASHGSRGLAESKYTANQIQSQHNAASRNHKKTKTSGTRNAQTNAVLRCYECEGFGHFGRECPTRQKRETGSTNSPGRRNPTERSRRSWSPAKGPHQKRAGSAKRKPRIR